MELKLVPSVNVVTEASQVLESWHGCACLDRYRNVPQLRLTANALRASLALWEGTQGTTYADQALAGVTVNLDLFQTLLKASVSPGVTRPKR